MDERWNVEYDGKTAWLWHGNHVIAMSSRSDAEQDARLVLMAAAPDLLEACKALMEYINSGAGNISHIMYGARAAIAKAEVKDES